MVASGELIRMMNFVDDIASTLRRINANLALMGVEERKRLAEYMRRAEPNYMRVVETLEQEP